MQIEIQWTQEDLERKLLGELAASGFRPIEEHNGDGKPKPKFKWTRRGGLRVVIRAEPDPNTSIPAPGDRGAILAVSAMNDATNGASGASPMAEQLSQAPLSEDDDLQLDPTMFPPGTDMRVIRKLEKAAKAEEAGRPIKRRLMKGESFERPEDD